MYSFDNVQVFVLRLLFVVILVSSYPLFHYFLNSNLLKMAAQLSGAGGQTELKWYSACLVNVIETCIPLCFALFYPNVGQLLSYNAAISGFIIQFTLPVVAHLTLIRPFKLTSKNRVWYLTQCFLHSFIILYGLLIVIL